MSEINKAEVIAQYARAEGDTGSPEVQVALLTARINSSSEILCLVQSPPLFFVWQI